MMDADLRRDLLELIRKSGGSPDEGLVEEFGSRIGRTYGRDEGGNYGREIERPTILDALNQQVVEYNSLGKVVRANRAAREVLGEDVVGMDVHRIMRRTSMRHPDGRLLRPEEMPACRALQGEAVAEIPVTITSCRGKTMNLLASASPVISGGGDGVIVTWQDITGLQTANRERRHLLRQMMKANADLLELSADLERQKQTLSDILASLPEFVMIVDDSGRLSYVNPPTARAIGVSPEDIIGRRWQDLNLPEEFTGPLMENVRSVFGSGRTLTGRSCWQFGQDLRYFDYTATPLSAPDGGVSAVLLTSRDVTGRRRMEDALVTSEEKYRLLFDRMLESAYLFEVVRDEDGRPVDYRYADLNLQAAKDLGHSRESLIGKSIRDVLGEVGEDWKEFMDEVAVTGRPGQIELYSPIMKRYMEISAYCPQCNQLALIANDITGRKEAEARLEESEEKFRSIAQRSFDIIATFDIEGNITYVSPAVTRVLGYTPEELIGEPSVGCILTSNQLLFRQAHTAVFEGREIENLQIELGKRDGGSAILEVNASPIVKEGKVAGIQVTGRDITGRKQAEAALLLANERLRELGFIVSKSPAIAVLRRASEGWPVEFVSDNIAEFGYSPEEFMEKGALYADVVHPDDRQRVSMELNCLAREGRSEFSQQYRIVTRAGDVRWIEDRTWVRRAEDGTITHYQGIVTDITGWKELDTMREAAYARIEQNIEQFAILGDHIRHPLQVIMAFCDIAGGENAEKIREQVERINTIIKQLDQGWVESRKIREFLRRNECISDPGSGRSTDRNRSS